MLCSNCKRETEADTAIVHAIVAVSPNEKGELICDDISLNPQYWSAYIGNVCMNLTRMEFKLLYCLMINRGNVLTYEQIYRLVWKDEYDGAACNNAIKNLIQRLRGKIVSAGGEHITIQNRWGIGYFLPTQR